MPKLRCCRQGDKVQHTPAYMQPIQWNDFQTFLAIARAGQIARAARALTLDATTVARRLRRLESRIGQTLFEQTRDGQTLTEAGERLLHEVEAMERAAVPLSERTSPGEGGLSGTLRVSVSEGFGTWFIARHLSSFTKANPQLVVDLVSTSGFLSPSKREADLAVLLARPASGQVVSRKLSDYNLRLYASPDYVAQSGIPLRREDMHRHVLISYIPDLIYAPELPHFDSIGADMKPQLRSSSINAQYQLVCAGAGIGLLPCFMGDRDSNLVKVLPGLEVRRSFWTVTHTATRQLQRVQAFQSWLVKLAAEQRSVLLGQPAGSAAPSPPA